MADGIGLELDNSQLNLAPGDNAVVRLNLTNTSNAVSAFSVSAMGLEPEWYTLSATEARLFPQQSSAITIEVHPPKSDALPVSGTYPLTVMVRSLDNPAIFTTAQVMINLSAVGGLTIDLQPRTISGRRGFYSVTISNSSNAARTTVLSLSDPEEALEYTLGTPSIREGEARHTDIFAAPTNTGYMNGTYVPPPPFGETTAKSKGVLEHEMELPAGAVAVVPLLVKPQNIVWTGKERPFPFTAGVHPPGYTWDASEAPVVQGNLAYRPIFAAFAGMPFAVQRALLFLIPLLILACLLFLLLRPQGNAGVSAANQTATAAAQSAAQTQTALALSLAQTQTAVAIANGGNVAAANATLTALAQSGSGTQTELASAQLTAQAGGNATTTALAVAAEGEARIDRFYLKLGNPQATATPAVGGIMGSEATLQYNVSGAIAVRINQASRPYQSTILGNASLIDYRMVATGTNQLPVTRTLTVLVVRPPAIESFDGSPLTVSAGDSTNLLWKVLGADALSIDGIPVTVSSADGTGQIGVQPTGTRRFILCATNVVGQVCKSVLVTVLPAGAPTPTPAPPTVPPPPTRVPTTAVPRPTTPVPIVTATACAEDYIVLEESDTVTPAANPVAGLQCDNCVSTVLLPFPFQLYDRVFDRVSVGSNGTLNFASTANPVSTNACLPSATSFDYAIFPHWDNLTTVGAGLGVFTSVSGEEGSRTFTIEWRARVMGITAAPTSTSVATVTAAPDYLNFQVRLIENAPDQRFEVIYGNVPRSGNSATIGVQRARGTNATQYSCNTAKISEGLKLVFILPCGGSGVGDRPLTCTPGDVVVNMQDNRFTPRNIIITQGSTVTWLNLDSTQHNTVGLDNIWTSPSLGLNEGFKRTFNTPGVYFYSSTLDEEMTGNITVLSVCTPTPTPGTPGSRTPTLTRTPAATRSITSTRVSTSTSTVTGTPPTSTPTSTGATGTATVVVTGTVTLTATVTTTPTGTRGTPTVTRTPRPGEEQCATIQSLSGSITATDQTQRGRVGLYDKPSTCATGDLCLPPPDSTPRHYDSYTFVNDDDIQRCINVTVDAKCGGGAGLMSAAYLGSYDPTNLCLNFLAQGGPPSSIYTYSFIVPAHTTYVIVVHEFGPDDGCASYTLDVTVCTNVTPSPTVVQPTRVVPTNPPPPPGVSNTPVRSATPTRTRTNTPVVSTPTSTSTGTSTPTFTSTLTATSTPTRCTSPNYGITAIAPAPSATVVVPGQSFISGSNVDNAVVTTTLPIAVQFYGQTYNAGSTLYLSTNGNLSFTPRAPDGENSCLPGLTSHLNTIFAFWDDLFPGGTGNPGIYTLLSGTAPNRIFYIEWLDYFSTTDNIVNFEIALYENQDGFDLLYSPNMSSSISAGTIGVLRDSSTFTQYSCNTQMPIDSYILRFRRGPCTTVTPSATPSPTQPFASPTTTPTATTAATNTSTATATDTPTYTPTATASATPTTGPACGATANFQVESGTLVFLDALTPVPGMAPCPTADCTATIDLPFPVRFYDLNASVVTIGDNGTLVLGNGPNPNPPDNQCLPTASLTYTILPYWERIAMFPPAGGAFTGIYGTAPNRLFVIRWLGMNSTEGFAEFEVVLYETPPLGRYSQFDVIYSDVPDAPTATIGVLKNDILFTQVICNSGMSSIDHTFFQPSCATATPTSTPGPACGPDSTYQIRPSINSYIMASNPVPGINPCPTIDCQATIDLPFSVRLYDMTANNVTIGDNGIMTLNGPNPNRPNNICLPDPELHYAIIPYWDALDLRSSKAGDGAFTQILGLAPNRVLVVRWKGRDAEGLTIDFEVHLYETPPPDTYSQIDFLYASISDASYVTAGIQKDATLFTQLVCNDPGHIPNVALFQPACATATPTTLVDKGPEETATPISTAVSGTPSQVPLPAGTVTATATFTPQPGEQCNQWLINPATDGAVLSADGTLESELDVPIDGVVSSISVSNIDIAKEGAGKLSGYVMTPSGEMIDIFHWTCARDADGNSALGNGALYRWLNITLTDVASRPVSAVYCSESVRGGLFRPDTGSLEKLKGTATKGKWTLLLKADIHEVDSVKLNGWGLNICSTASTLPANRVVSAAPDIEASSGVDLLLAVIAAALATIGAPLAWSKTRGSFFIDKGGP